MLRLRIAVLMLAPLLAALAAVACGSPQTAAGPTQSPQAAASAPAATSTPAPTPPSPPQAGGTVVDVTPVVPGAAGIAVARTDCPASWVTWRDVTGVVSFCTPSGMFGASGALAGGGGITVASDLGGKRTPNLPSVAISAGVSSQPYFAGSVPLSELCKQVGVPGLVRGEEIHLVAGGFAWQGCHGVGETYAPQGPLESLQICAAVSPAASPTPRYLCATDNWRTQSQGAQALAYQILGTLRVGP